MEKIKPFLTKPDVPIKGAWKQLNDNGYKILFVIDEKEHLCGSVTDGDVRRWILEDRSLLDPIHKAMCRHPMVSVEGEGKAEIREKLVENRIDCIPVVNSSGTILKLVFWDDLFKNGELAPLEKIPNPVVIMAGGRGERLDPFTKILPKPLMPIGDKPVIEVIMSKFKKYGVSDFFISLNYKSHMIRAYFEDAHHEYNLHYVYEKTPLGTAGSIHLMKDQLKTTFIVSNADIIVDANYADILKFHQENKNKLTLVCSMKHFPVPYGVVEIKNGGSLKGIREKPEFDHLVLTGLYIVEPEVIQIIPRDKEFHMTHLIDKLRAESQKIGVYPVSDKAWMDIGELESYQETLRKLRDF